MIYIKIRAHSPKEIKEKSVRQNITIAKLQKMSYIKIRVNNLKIIEIKGK